MSQLCIRAGLGIISAGAKWALFTGRSDVHKNRRCGFQGESNIWSEVFSLVAYSPTLHPVRGAGGASGIGELFAGCNNQLWQTDRLHLEHGSIAQPL